jgi:hypothetical protein
MITLVTMNKTLAIATILMTAALAGILSTSPIAFAQDESATNTEQEIRQENDGSGESTNNNCALNSIDTTLAATVACPVTELLTDSTTLEETPSAPEIE